MQIVRIIFQTLVHFFIKICFLAARLFSFWFCVNKCVQAICVVSCDCYTRNKLFLFFRSCTVKVSVCLLNCHLSDQSDLLKSGTNHVTRFDVSVCFVRSVKTDDLNVVTSCIQASLNSTTCHCVITQIIPVISGLD